MTRARLENLGFWCSRAVERFADRPALIDLSQKAPRRLSYAQLESRLNRVANLVLSRGIAAGGRVALALSNRSEFVEIMYGAMRAGAVPVPLNTKLGAATLDYTIRDAGCVAAFIEPDCNRFIQQVVEDAGLDRERCFCVGQVSGDWLAYEAELACESEDFEPAELAEGHPAFQPYTSGSTGKPKGVVLTHSGQLWWIRCLEKYWPSGVDGGVERALAAVPLYHKNAMAGAVKPMLATGGSVVLLPDFEPRRFLETLAAYECTRTGAVPAVFTKLLQHRDLIESLDLSHLKSISIGSAPVQEELLLSVRDAFGVKVSESYGLTEGGPVMIGPPVDGREVPPGSCGVPWPEGEVKLVDAGGAISDSYGELWVRNPGVTPGYHNLPDINAERLRDGWLATGDLFRCDADGFFYFRGRVDDMFNCGGENIYPKEVENLLLSHDGVYDAAVVPVPHPVKGEVPVAMIMRAPEAGDGLGLDEATLKQFCLERGPAYAHPRRVLIVESLPLNGAGKVDRAVVQARMQARFGPEIAEAGSAP